MVQTLDGMSNRLEGDIGDEQGFTSPRSRGSTLEAARAVSSGRSAHTVYGGHEHSLRQTLIALTAGSELAEHESPGEATLQVLVGRVRLTNAGALGRHRSAITSCPQSRHGLQALEDSRCC
jgi:quercetin dioxygenase-like cupin family protein